MKLLSVRITNYRSIEDLTIQIKKLNDESFAYGLIGVNEAGKSSILKALAQKDNSAAVPVVLKDFRERDKPVEIIFNYEPSVKEVKDFKAVIKEKAPTNEISNLDFSSVQLTITINKANTGAIQVVKSVRFPKIVDEEKSKSLIETHLKEVVSSKAHKTIFWKADEKYLISKPINLQQFATNADGVSIPLKNCFKLAGIDYTKYIPLISDSTEREWLKDQLGEKVTNHINQVWKKHPIKITFDISDGNLNFHVKDLQSAGRAKTADQRSDGFRQFISFLLTVSAENKNNALENSILLLDEPETHLHPKAQEDILRELIKITQKEKNNIAFFATHSNYMIDKDHLERNAKVEKPQDTTKLRFFEQKESTFSSVNYDVFGIVSSDYHNELYGKVQVLSEGENSKQIDEIIQTTVTKVPIKNYEHSEGKSFKCTLPTYIRHQIHHPENDENKRFSPVELEKSIKILKETIQVLEKSGKVETV